MSYKPGTWYNELYRIFAQDDLLTIEQTIQLGQCLRAIQAGENADYHLQKLETTIRGNKELSDALDEFRHAYNKYQEEVSE